MLHKNSFCFKSLLRHGVLRVFVLLCFFLYGPLCHGALNLTYLHCFQHSFFEHLFILYGLLLQATCIVCLTAMFSHVSVTVSLGQNLDQIINVGKNNEAIIPCRTATYNYPEWYGQPATTLGALTLYNWDRSSTFFTSLTNRGRLSWAANNKDLVLSNVVSGDSGRYQCGASGVGTWTVQLNVIGISVFVLNYEKQ